MQPCFSGECYAPPCVYISTVLYIHIFVYTDTFYTDGGEMIEIVKALSCAQTVHMYI